MYRQNRLTVCPERSFAQAARAGFACIVLALIATAFIGCSEPTSQVDRPDSSDVDDTADDDLTETIDPLDACSIAIDPVSENLAPVLFRRLDLPVIDRHEFVATERDLQRLGYGVGGGLIDFDGDGFIDVFLGQADTDGSVPCLYRNISAREETRFEKWSCFPELGSVVGARTADWNGDGTTELLLYSEDELFEVTPSTLESPRKIFDARESSLTADDGCLINSVIEAPTASAGLLIGFGPRWDIDDTCRIVQLIRNSEDALSARLWPETDFSSGILAMGIADVDTNGTLDTLVIVDTFSGESKKNTALHPGGAYLSEQPDFESKGEFVPWLSGTQRAWGSFMGGAMLNIGGLSHLILSDWGLPLLRRASDGGDAGILLAPTLSTVPAAFSWSAVVADFNLDQRDDMLLTRSTALPRDTPEENPTRGEEADILLLQTDEGFVDVSAASGLIEHPPGYIESSAFNRPHYSRAAAATDLDRDGRVEVLIMPFEGRPLVYEATEPTHCLARVSSPYLDLRTQLYGWSWLDALGGAHPLRADANMRLGEPQWLLVPAMRGALRSPTGARIPYTCDPGQRIVVTEPEWIEKTESTVHFDLCAARLSNTLVQTNTRSEDDLATHEVSVGSATEVNAGDDGVDLYIDGQFSVFCPSVGPCVR